MVRSALARASPRSSPDAACASPHASPLPRMNAFPSLYATQASMAFCPSGARRTFTQLVPPMNSQVTSSACGRSQRVMVPPALPFS